MSRLRPYTAPSGARRSLNLRLPPNLQRFCRNVFAGVMLVFGPYCAVLTVLICAKALGLL